MESIANKLNELVISQLEERQFELFNKFITELKDSDLLEDEDAFDDFVSGFKKNNKKITQLVQKKTVKNTTTSSGGSQNNKKTDKKSPGKKRAPNAFSYISGAYKTLEFQTTFQDFIMTQEEIEEQDLIGRGSHLRICGIVLNRIKDNEEALELYNSLLQNAINDFNESSESSSDSDKSQSKNQQNNDSDSEEEEIQAVTKPKHTPKSSKNQQNNDSDSEEEEIQVVTKPKHTPKHTPKHKSSKNQQNNDSDSEEEEEIQKVTKSKSKVTPKKSAKKIIVYNNADSSDESSDDSSDDEEDSDEEHN